MRVTAVGRAGQAAGARARASGARGSGGRLRVSGAALLPARKPRLADGRRRLGRLPPRGPELPGPLAQPQDRAQGADRGLRLPDRDRLPADPLGPASGRPSDYAERALTTLDPRRGHRGDVPRLPRRAAPSARRAAGGAARGLPVRPARPAGSRRRRPALRRALARAASEAPGSATPARSAARGSTELRRAEERAFDRVFDSAALRAGALGRDRLPGPLRLHPRRRRAAGRPELAPAGDLGRVRGRVGSASSPTSTTCIACTSRA